jgi:hypothetical protein
MIEAVAILAAEPRRAAQSLLLLRIVGHLLFSSSRQGE